MHRNLEHIDSNQREEGGGKKRKGLVKQQVWMTQGHGQQCGGLTVGAGGWPEEGKGGKIWTTVVE